ncbi:MAG: alpha/beta hydrolase, partial [Betaproteobacteria bacterium]|nr:alpha/beta hydrolase [Betaproteobacteria bacterium]
ALVERLPGTQLTLLTGGHMLPITQIETTTAFIEDMARQVFA